MQNKKDKKCNVTFVTSFPFFPFNYISPKMNTSNNKKVVVHLTGFGRFKDVEENPTTFLIQHLPSYFKEFPLPVRTYCV
jgi:hypothetical protein